MELKIGFIDHIVFIVPELAETRKFYSTFLGQPEYDSDTTLVYKTGETKVFFVLPSAGFEKPDKDKGGFNHIAFGVRSVDELREFENALNAAAIKHSGIKIDTYGNKEFIWLDDPAGMRVEIYCRTVDE
jgi:glyoxylase I family protein